MKGLWLVFAVLLEITVLGALIGKGMQYRHYNFENYKHIVLTEQQYSDLIIINPKTLFSFIGFMTVGELQGRPAVEQSAYFCQLISVCLNDEEKEYIRGIEQLNYRILRNIIAFDKQYN